MRTCAHISQKEQIWEWGEDQELDLTRIKFEMSIRRVKTPRKRLDFHVWQDLGWRYKLRVISIRMLFKAMRLKEITKGANINRKEKMCKDWILELSVDLKKIHNVRVMIYWGQNSFIWGQNENCSPRCCTSDSSEKLLQWGEVVGRSVYVVLVKGEFIQSSTFFAEVFCQPWGADVTMRGFSALLDRRRCKEWAHKISSWKYLAI